MRVECVFFSRFSSWILFLVFSLSILLVLPSLVSAEVRLSAKDSARLHRGEILVSEHTTASSKKGGKRFVKARLLLKRPIRVVWALLKNQESLFQNNPRVQNVKVIKRETPSRELVKTTLLLSPLLPKVNYVTRVNYHSQAKRMCFYQVRGDFKTFQGETRLQALDQGKTTLLSYQVHVDPGHLVPSFLTHSILRSSVPDMMRHVRKRIYSRGGKGL